MSILMWYVVVINFAAAVALLCYRRKGAAFKRHLSALAGVLLALTGFNVIRVVTGLTIELPVTFPEVIMQTILCALVLISKGNVSHMLPWRHQQ